MTNTPPLLSIIVPVYNMEKYLSSCLKSICDGVVRVKEGVEVIVVNDGSNDSSADIIEEFQTDYPYINAINKTNGGLSAARNTGLKASNGKFVWFVDSDDSINPENFLELIEILVNTEADYLTVDAKLIVEGEFKEVVSLDKAELESTFKFEFNSHNLLGAFSLHMVWLRIYSRNKISDIEFPEGHTHEDINFDLKVLATEPLIEHTNLCLYNHLFDNPDSITNNMNEKKFMSILWNFQDLDGWFLQKGMKADTNKVLAEIKIKHLIKTHSYLFQVGCPWQEKFRVSKAIQKELLISISNASDSVNCGLLKERLSVWLLTHRMFTLSFIFNYLYTAVNR